jgi:NitT/TauT family transport system substrate-binding protein
VLIALALVVLSTLTFALVRQFGGALAEEPRMRLGLVAVPEQEPIAVAAATGMLDRSRVLVVEFYSLQDLQNAFLDGNVHAGVFHLDDALRLVQPPVGARIEGFLGESHGALSLMTPRPLATIAELRGHRIGLESGRRTMAALREILARGGLTLGDVDLRQLDADSSPLALERGQVDAVLVYTPSDLRLAQAGAHVIDRWTPGPEGDLLVLLASGRAHRLAAGQIAHITAAWDAGARALAQPDSVTRARVAVREEVAPGDVAAVLSPQRWFGAAEDARLRGPAGRPTLDSALAGVRGRWWALGVLDTVPPARSWLPAPVRRSS